MDKKASTSVDRNDDKAKTSKASSRSKDDKSTTSLNHHGIITEQQLRHTSQYNLNRSSTIRDRLSTSAEVTRLVPAERIAIAQNFFLIWLDSSIDETNEDCKRSLTKLQRIVNTIKTFTNPEECVDFIRGIKDENIFMIASGNIGFDCVPRVHQMSQIDSIYIFCGNRSKHEQWAKDWKKIKGVFTDIRSLCEVLQEDVRVCDRDSTPITMTNARNPDELDPTFMYTTLFKETILEIQYDKNEIRKLADKCREIYHDNNMELRIIDEFEREYDKHSPIWWYTRECFTYHVLNQALRTFNTNSIVMMGIFIQHLNRHIEQLYSEQIHSFPKEIILYRGQGLSQADFKKLQEMDGGLLSFNSFLSTSHDRNVSLGFAAKALKKPNHVGVLFIMTVDSTCPSSPFVLIDTEGYYQGMEKEILFSMNSIFRIRDVKKHQTTKDLFEIELTLTGNHDHQLQKLTETIREQISGPTGWHRLGKLLLQSGDLEQAESLYLLLLTSTAENDSAEIGFLNHQLGQVYSGKGEHSKALEYYEKAHKISEQALPPTHPDLAAIYSNIGRVYSHMGEYSKALEYYEKDLEISEQALPPTHPDLATSYNNIGRVYADMGEYSRALEYYEKAHKITKQALPPTHPDLATSYSNIGQAYSYMGEYSRALEYYEKDLEITKQALPPTHPSLTTSYSNIGRVYSDMGEYAKALEYYERAHKIYEQSLPPTDPSFAGIYSCLGRLYRSMKNYTKAHKYFEQTLEIDRNTLGEVHPYIAITYGNIGDVHRWMGDLKTARSFLKKALNIQENVTCDPTSLAWTYNYMGETYRVMKQYVTALEYHEKAQKIREKSLPPTHPDLAATQHHMARIYFEMNQYQVAYEHAQRTIEIAEQKLSEKHPDLLEYKETLSSLQKEI